MSNWIISEKLVEQNQRNYGRFEQTPIANPIDEFQGMRRFFKNLRLKEWVGFAIFHPDIYGAMIIQNAKIIKSSDFHIFENSNSNYTNFQSVSISPKLKISEDLLHSTLHFDKKTYSIKYEFANSTVVISIHIKATKNNQAIKGEIVLDVNRKSKPLVVSALLPPSGTMYTNKIIYPASGYLQVGDRKYEFLPERDILILDEHKSQLPYKTEWTWGTFAFPIENSFVGANFAIRPQYPDQEEESCLWTTSGVEALKDIVFEPQEHTKNALWHIYSKDGRLDVIFTPLGQKDVRENALVFSIDYYQMFGTYSGKIVGKDKVWNFENIHGYCEQMKMKA